MARQPAPKDSTQKKSTDGSADAGNAKSKTSRTESYDRLIHERMRLGIVQCARC